MLKRIILVFCMLFLFVGVSSAGQFVENGGFEEGDDDPADNNLNADYWNGTKSTSDPFEVWLDVSTFRVKSGDYSLKMEAQDGSVTPTGHYAYLNQTVNLSDRSSLSFDYLIYKSVPGIANFTLTVGNDLLLEIEGDGNDQIKIEKYEDGTTTSYKDVDSWYKDSVDVSDYTGDTVISFKAHVYGDYTQPGYGGISAHVDNVGVEGEKPILISPEDGSTVNTTYPPLLHEVDLEWDKSTFSDTYRYQIAEDSEFNQIVEDDYTAYTEETVSLTEGTYYWRVYPYDTDTEELGNVSDTYSFTINESGGEGEGTAINGVVYERENGDPEPLQNAIVNIYNDTYSDQATTGSNGFYVFEGLDSTSTYSIQVTKTDYEDSEIQLVTPTENETTTQNILMQTRTDESQYYSPHYVEFTIKSFNGAVYDDVEVKVYKGDDAASTFTQTTGADGGVSFKLDQNQQYTLTLESDEHDIDTEYTVTPRDTHYNIYVSLWDEPTREENDVEFFLTQEEIDLESGYINATWNDTTGLTEDVTMFINDTDDNTLYQLDSTNSTGNFSQEVDNNATYLVKFQLDSGGLTETFERTGTITFNAGVNDAFDLGFSEQWHYSLVGALIITLIASFFGVANAHAGAFMVALGGWFMLFIGWFATGPVTVAMLVFATLLSVGFYLRKGETPL